MVGITLGFLDPSGVPVSTQPRQLRRITMASALDTLIQGGHDMYVHLSPPPPVRLSSNPSVISTATKVSYGCEVVSAPRS